MIDGKIVRNSGRDEGALAFSAVPTGDLVSSGARSSVIRKGGRLKFAGERLCGGGLNGKVLANHCVARKAQGERDFDWEGPAASHAGLGVAAIAVLERLRIACCDIRSSVPPTTICGE